VELWLMSLVEALLPRQGRCFGLGRGLEQRRVDYVAGSVLMVRLGRREW
jgi:hypothetical protein